MAWLRFAGDRCVDDNGDAGGGVDALTSVLSVSTDAATIAAIDFRPTFSVASGAGDFLDDCPFVDFVSGGPDGDDANTEAKFCGNFGGLTVFSKPGN